MKHLVTIALLFLLQSCTMSAAELKTAHPSWTDEQIEVVANGQVYVGMPAEQFNASWGKALHSRIIRSRTGMTQFLHYANGTMVCLRNGVVVSIHSG